MIRLPDVFLLTGLDSAMTSLPFGQVRQLCRKVDFHLVHSGDSCLVDLPDLVVVDLPDFDTFLAYIFVPFSPASLSCPNTQIHTHSKKFKSYRTTLIKDRYIL